MNSEERFILSLDKRPPPCIRLNSYAQKLAYNFPRTKKEIMEHLFEIYNKKIFRGKLQRNKISFKWSKSMVRTLGKTIFSKAKPHKKIVIKLSRRQLTSASSLHYTFAHELCHVANVMIDGLYKAGHGPAWKYWTSKIARKYPNLRRITRLDSETPVHYKFIFLCSSCKKTVCKRHRRPSQKYTEKLKRARTLCCKARLVFKKNDSK